MRQLDELSTVTEELLGSPFAWCHVTGGAVMLKDATSYGGSKGGAFQVRDFAIAKYPITNAQYDLFIKHENGFANPQWWAYSLQAQQWHEDRPKPKPTAFPGDNLPRTRVSWFDALAFCYWLSAELNNKMENFIGQVRLPTEPEWQRAAVGDTGWHYPWGNEVDETFANFGNKDGQPGPVGLCPKNISPSNVTGMIGNVWEWCLTGWETQENDLSGYKYRMIKGGAWNVSNLDHLRATDRGANSPRGRLNDCGFRCAYTFQES